MKKITFFLTLMLSLLSALTANAQHEFVDLGLPSGTLWATCNVGANSPEEFGDYFAWGETATKADYSWSGYKHANGSGSALTRYCTNNSYGTVDGKTVLGQADDAAEANWDNTWEMPSMEQFRELLNDEYTTVKKTMQNDVYGMLITGKRNGKSIFLPAAGIRMETELYNDGSRAYFWSHDLNTGSNDKALDFNFDTRNMSLTDTQSRCYGLSIRPVRKIEHDYVDLGLPSGTLWATCNVGAKNPADYGGYFAWGETTTKSDYSWGTYKWMNPGQASLEQINKYTIADGNTGACWYDSNGQFIGDNKTTLVPADDAATINWGDDWQMPSKEQLRELINSDYTTSTWAAQTRSDGLLNYGILITSKKNGNSIFLPAAGFHDGTRVVLEDYETRYWSTQLGYHTSGWAFSEWFASRNENETTPKYQSTSDGDPRYLGQCIRPVRAEPQPEVYTEFVEATGTLTYYYDNKRESRSGVTEVYDPINNLETKRFDGYAEKVLKGVIDPSMKQAPLTSMREMFFGRDRNYLTAMTTVEGLGNLNTSIVTDMSYMFVACEALTTLDLSSFNTQSVVNISYMFLGCSSLTTLDLSTFNTEKVTNMESMFNGCRSLSMLNLSSFNTKNVTDMEATFCFCSSLTTLDLSSFNAQNVTNTRGMFYYCKLLTELDLNSFNVQNVEDLETMFTGCESLTTIYCDNDWSSIGAQSEYMFKDCTALVGGRGTTYNAAFVDATYARPDGGTSAPGYFTLSSENPEFYVEFVRSTRTLTYYYDEKRATRTGLTGNGYLGDYWAMNALDLDPHEVRKAVIDPSMKRAPLTSTVSMFSTMRNMTAIEGLENLNTANVTDMSDMFLECQQLTSLDLSSFNTVNVETMDRMFNDCSALESLDLSSFNTANVKTMDRIFNGCSALESLDLSSFNTANVTNMSYMFADCKSLTSLDLSSFNTANVENMEAMFYNCMALPSLDLSSFNTANVTNMSWMFNSCSSLTTIWCDKDWSASPKLESSRSMFGDCSALVGGEGTRFDSNFTDKTYARPDGGTERPGYFTEKPSHQGDLNGDKKVDIADAVTVLNIMAASEFKAEADLNGDEKIDIADFVTVLNIMAAQ